MLFAVAQPLAQRMLADAETARHRPGTTAAKLTAMHAAWFGTYAETIRHSPHAAELLDAKYRLSADLSLTPPAATNGWSATSRPKPPPPESWTWRPPASRRTPPPS